VSRFRSPHGLLPGQVTASEDGFVGGVQAGYNWQFRCTVFGIEADYSWADINHDRTFTTGGLVFPGGATLWVNNDHQAFGTVRAGSGLIVDNLLLYVTGGFAYANFNRSVTLSVPALGIAETFEQDKTRWGWTFGFGTEWAAWNNWTIKSEVLYARFQNEDSTFTCTGVFAACPTGATRSFERQDSLWVTRIGINYKFGGYAPVVANY
jgi:outer membrane immunogenic protein